jgi:hypothetical protein
MSKFSIGEIEDYGRREEGGMSVAYGGKRKNRMENDKLSE